MENVLREDLIIYGKEELELHFENRVEQNVFISSLYKEFKHVATEISLMRITDELMVAKIEMNGETTSRLYRKDGKYVEITGDDSTYDAMNMLTVIKGQQNTFKGNEFKEAEISFPDNYGNYVKSVPGFVIQSKILKMMQDYMYNGVNVLIKGGPGTGKTEFPQRLAEALGMESLVVDCGTIKTPQDWFGTREYVEGQGTTFVTSQLVEYLQQPSIIILDEINRTTPDCHNSIFRILDGNRQVHIMALKKTIKVHPHCIIVATMNEGRSHTGTFMMDSAITDRFEVFTLNIPTESQITKLLANRFPTVSNVYLELLSKLTHKINNLYRDEYLNVQVGLRAALSACVLLKMDNKLIDVLEQSFIGRFSNEGGVDSEATMVRQAITGLMTKEILNSKNSTIDEILKEEEENENNKNDDGSLHLEYRYNDDSYNTY